MSTTYLGLELANPIVVSSSSLTNSVAKVQNLERFGAGAVVLKSLFEEQMHEQANFLLHSSEAYPEAADYLRSYISSNAVSDYLEMIKACKASVSIPVIASVNCVTVSGWMEYAKAMEQAGADAIEINVYYMPVNIKPSSYYENIYFEIATQLKKSLKIPFVFKLGSSFTNLVALTDQLAARGASGVVLFNRYYEPDIDVRTMRFGSSDPFSSPNDMGHSLRWVSMISGLVPELQIAASTGIHSGWDVIRQLLAGAQITQVCSTLYKNGPEHIGRMLTEVKEWMGKHKYDSLEDFRGVMNFKNIPDPSLFQRTQYMKYFMDNY